MSKFSRSMIITVLTVLVAVGLAAKLEPAAKFVHEDAKGKLTIIGKAAVVLTGDDQFVNRIMEDVTAIGLLGRGIKVAYPDENSFGKLRREPGKDPMQVARTAGANVLLTGMVVTEPVCPSDCGRECQHPCRSLKVNIASLSLVDVPQDKVLVWALYEPDSAVSTSRLATAFVELLVESLK
ncbi:MAG: hypothetical protein ABIL25_03935 [candidate division WOR-3 bacterium]